MKKFLLLLLITAASVSIHAQALPCDSFCVTDIAMDTSGSSLNITIFLKGDSTLFINYPYVSAVTIASGDTVAAGTLNSFGQFGGTSATYVAATTLVFVPGNFTATIYLQYNNTFCSLPYPCRPCNFTPTISGAEELLCPNEQGLLATQTYDSYQWYRWMFGDTITHLIPGATSQTLPIDQFSDAGYYFFVEATDTGCTESSAEVLVDGWVFVLPHIEITEYDSIGTINGEAIICEGDTAYLILRPPFDTLITWFKNGTPIQGATGSVLPVTEAGSYSVQGSPSVCPDFVDQLGAPQEVLTMNCPTGVSIPRANAPSCHWNSLENTLHIKNILPAVKLVQATLYSLDGRMLMQQTTASENTSARITFLILSGGTYICKIQFDNSKAEITQKLAVIE